MCNYFSNISLNIAQNKEKRDKELVIENKNLLKDASNIDFLTELKEKKSEHNQVQCPFIFYKDGYAAVKEKSNGEIEKKQITNFIID